MLVVEPFEIRSIVTGSLRLDGGAMFGVVPKVLWESKADVDELNRILLATRTLLAVDRAGGRVILVETGPGTKWTPEKADRFGIHYDREAIPAALNEAGLTIRDVTDVIITHLHFDHNGGLTEWVDEVDGATRLCYPQARHWIHKRQWEQANHPHPKDRASYFKEDFAALAGGRVLHMIEGEEPVPPFEGVEWFVSNGHTPGQLLPIFGTGPRRLMFVGDVIPTIAHLGPAWVMAYDMAPVETISEKERIFARCLEEGMMLAFPHDPQCGGVSVDGTIRKPIVVEKLDL